MRRAGPHYERLAPDLSVALWMRDSPDMAATVAAEGWFTA